MNVEVSLRSNEVETAEALACFTGVFTTTDEGDNVVWNYSDLMMVLYFCSSDDEATSWNAMWNMWAYSNNIVGQVTS